MAIKDNTILIIDDDPDIIKLLTKIFEVLGVVVCSATNLKEAKEITLKTLPDLIFLDIKLGTENGLDYMTFLQTLSLGKSLPVIVFSGVDEKKMVNEAIKRGAIDFVKKPIVASLMIQKARKYLKEKMSGQIFFQNYQDMPQSFKVSGEIKRINQNYMELETNVKISSGTYLELNSQLCEKIDFKDGKFTSGDYVRTLDLGKYLNKIYYIGANINIIEKINKLRFK